MQCENFINLGDKILFQCTQCVRCCSNLSVIDMMYYSYVFRTNMFRRKCKFIDGNSCSIYKSRPKRCREWECGVVYERK